jgi:hypothetical protein
MDWFQIKIWLTELTGISRDALHILGGFIVQLFVAAVLRRSVAHPAPWAIALVLAGVNEWFDLNYEVWPDRNDQWAESVKDFLITMAIPSALLAMSRFWPALLVTARPPAQAMRQDDGSDMAAAHPTSDGT